MKLLLLILLTCNLYSSIDIFESKLQTMVDNQKPSSISLAVLKDSEVIYQSSFGFNGYKKEQLSTNESNYHIYSLTKMFAVAVTMQLVEEKKLDLQTDIETFFPRACFSYDDKKEHIKVINFLNHSSGISDRSSQIKHFFYEINSENKEALECYELPYKVGSEAKYSSAEYMILSAILEKVSGESFADLVQTRILNPLGMKETDFYYSPEMSENQVHGTLQRFSLIGMVMRSMSSDSAKDHYEGNTFYMNEFEVQWHAAGGLVSTISDMSKFLAAFEKEELFSKESATFMREYPQVQVNPFISYYDDVKFSIGWYDIHNHNSEFLQHQGMGPGFRTIMRIYPKEGLSFVILTNQTETDIDALADDVFDEFKH